MTNPKDMGELIGRPNWQLVPRYHVPPPEALGKQVLLWKFADETYYTARWVDSETMGPVWATPDGHVIFGDVLWTDLPPISARGSQ